MNPSDVVRDFSRYSDLIQSLLRPQPFSPTTETARDLQIERGLIFPDSILGKEHAALQPIDRILEIGKSPTLPGFLIVDRTGHHRPVYLPLLVYACLQSFRLLYEVLPRSEFGQWEEGLRPWCDHLESTIEDTLPDPSGGLSAGRGSTITQAAWTALALYVAGKVYIRDAWTDLASAFFGKITQAQTQTGAFFTATASDNPETWWYHELVLLHAAASYAVQSEDRHLANAVARNAIFHQNETQPDHATTQPWALFAFIWNPQTRPLADQLLHAAQVQGDGVSQIVLADCLYCLSLFL